MPPAGESATRYAIWCLVLAAVACLPLVRMRAPRRAAVSRITIVEGPARPVVRRSVTPVPLHPHIETHAVTPLATVHLRNRWQVILFGLWATGTLLMLTAPFLELFMCGGCVALPLRSKVLTKTG